MKNKGFTTVELIVSFSLVTIITILLFQLIFVLKDLYVYSGMKIKLLTKSAKMSTPINDDIATKNLMSASKISDNEISFCFADGSCKNLSFDTESKTVSYGDLTQELVDGSEFGNIVIKTETFISTYDTQTLNSILTIKLPVYTKLIEGEDFGINIVYLYNSNAKSLTGLNVSNIKNSEIQLQLLGNEEDIAYKDVSYIDPGYISVGSNYYVETTGSVDTSRIGNYFLTYTMYDNYRNLIDQKVRTVTVINTEYRFTYSDSSDSDSSDTCSLENGECNIADDSGKESYEIISISEDDNLSQGIAYDVPVTGKYFVQLWGASGGGNNSMSGKGGYTEGYFNLSAGDKLNFFIGGKGSISTSGVKATGGFNGGGDSGLSTSNFAGSGGGATDVRLNGTTLSKRILVAGGGGGAGSLNDSVYYCFGGSGGGTTGTSCDKCNVYSGGAGTSTAGGAKSTYTTNLTSNATAGTLGEGGTGASYSDATSTYAAGGGGGGYYGGGGGARYGSGGGGSGFCGIATDCFTLDGTNLIKNPQTNKYEKGHTGNGYAIIKLISIAS